MIMMKHYINRAALVALLCSLLLPVCLKAYHQVKPLYKYPSQEKIDRQVDSVFRKLSTREKIAQIMVIEFSSKEEKKRLAEQKRLIRKYKIGGLIPMNDVLVPAMKRMNKLNKWAKVPMLITIDGEWGANMRWKEIPAYPRFMQMGALGNEKLVEEAGRLIGQECRMLKIQVNFSPDVDINNNPNNPAINTRSFGEDKEKVAKYSAAMMQGMKSGGVAGSAKHFPGHGDTDVDSHLALPVLPFSAERLDTLELYPFRHMIAEGVDMIMVAHLNVPALDSSGTPASISKIIVTDFLKEKLGYKGIICTDALNMDGVAKESGLEKKDIPLAAYKAGADILLMPEDVENSINVIEQALKSGEISMEGLDERVKKMLALKARLGLFDKGYDPYVNIDKLDALTDQENPGVHMQDKLKLIKDIAKQSMTVIYNDNSAGYGLPVSFEGKKVAYVGYKNPQLGHEFGTLAKRYGPIDTLLLGNDASLADLKDARNKLCDHDLIIMGFNETDQRPHKNYAINHDEVNFITDWAAQQPMIAVYLGSPYALTRIPGYKNFSALVLGYINTQVNNFAAAQVVFGGIPAKGVLPVTAASFKVGESIIIPDRYREEYNHFIGSKADSLMNVPYNMKEKSAYISLLPQVAELLASGKVSLDDTIGELLDSDDINASQTLAKVFYGYEDKVNTSYLQAIVNKYRKYVKIEDVAQKLWSELGMKSTKFAENKDDSVENSIPEVITTKADVNKMEFIVSNKGRYAGKQILSEEAAKHMSCFITIIL